jgi:hypothetical protein
MFDLPNFIQKSSAFNLNKMHKSITIRISKELSLNATGLEQDWYLEATDKDRILEFIKYYKGKPLAIKQATLALIIASFDDLLQNPSEGYLELWNEVSILIRDDFEEVKDVLSEWPELQEADNFKVSYLISSLIYAILR